jgi:hypothetical protein
VLVENEIRQAILVKKISDENAVVNKNIILYGSRTSKQQTKGSFKEPSSSCKMILNVQMSNKLKNNQNL